MDIEFRAWAKLETWEKMMFDNEALSSWTLLDIQDQDNWCVIMQSTWLRDKNGDMIFESDIINTGEHDFEKNLIVEWNQKIAGFQMVNTTTRSFSYFNPEKTEIIGNIFENPELLNS